jgi:hypothetical protein
MNFLQAVRWSAQLFLGLFVVWQLLFLIGANFGEVAERYQEYWKENEIKPAWIPASRRPQFEEWLNNEGRFYKSLKKVDQIASRWSELTGQHEQWSLFAPGVWDNAAFLAVEFRWDEGQPGQQESPGCRAPPVYLLSENEPDNVNRYIRLGRFRLRKYEENLTPYLSERETASEAKLSWRDSIERKVRKRSEAINAYLRWRWYRYQDAHPELPEPNQVILHVRVYRIPAPEGPDPWTWDGPDVCPMARWRPPANSASLEVYDPVAERFD